METLDERTRIAYAVAAGGGALIWIAATAISGRTEAWDSLSAIRPRGDVSMGTSS